MEPVPPLLVNLAIVLVTAWLTWLLHDVWHVLQEWRAIRAAKRAGIRYVKACEEIKRKREAVFSVPKEWLN